MQLRYHKVVALSTWECARQTSLPPQFLQVFGAHEASWLHCGLCSQSPEHLHYVTNLVEQYLQTKTQITRLPFNANVRI